MKGSSIVVSMKTENIIYLSTTSDNICIAWTIDNGGGGGGGGG